MSTQTQLPSDSESDTELTRLMHNVARRSKEFELAQQPMLHKHAQVDRSNFIASCSAYLCVSCHVPLIHHCRPFLFVFAVLCLFFCAVPCQRDVHVTPCKSLTFRSVHSISLQSRVASLSGLCCSFFSYTPVLALYVCIVLFSLYLPRAHSTCSRCLCVSLFHCCPPSSKCCSIITCVHGCDAFCTNTVYVCRISITT